mgnify:CR=1 FL=1
MSALDLVPAYVRDALLAPPIPQRLRDDLRIIPRAEAAGWSVRFPNDNWSNAAQFQNGDAHVWLISTGGTHAVLRWKRARLDPGTNRFEDGVQYAELEDALMLPSRCSLTTDP